MLRFVKHHLETISGIEVFPIISLVIFFLFFFALTLWVIKADKRHLERMRHMPLNGTPNETPRP